MACLVWLVCGARDQAYLQSKMMPGIHDLGRSSLPGLSGLASVHCLLHILDAVPSAAGGAVQGQRANTYAPP